MLQDSNKINLADILDVNDSVLDMFKDEEIKNTSSITFSTNVVPLEDDSHIEHLADTQVHCMLYIITLSLFFNQLI